MLNFVNLTQMHRQLELMVQAVWGQSSRIQAAPTNLQGAKIEAGTVLLPANFGGLSNHDIEQYYLCATLHAVAHLMYSKPSDATGLNNRQLVLMSLYEDARIETLLFKQFPGLRQKFLSRFKKTPLNTMQFDDIAYALALSIIQQECVVENALVAKGFKAFTKLNEIELQNSEVSKTLGMALANDIGQLRISMNEKTHFALVDYRDDNAYLWQHLNQVGMESNEIEQNEDSVSVTGVAYQETQDGQQVSGHEKLAEKVPGLVISEAENDSENTLMHAHCNEQVFSYPEWDYKSARLRTPWSSVIERQYDSGAVNHPTEREQAFQGLIQKLQRIIQSYQASQQRRHKQEEGIELDLSAMIDQRIELKSGHSSSEAKIYIDHFKPEQQSLSLMVLLDLSESMNDKTSTEQTLLDLTLDASIVLSGILNALGHTYALHGFNSNTRNEVNYVRIKDFESNSSLNVSALENITAEYSTRLGAGMRHAFELIKQCEERHKLIVVITDGEPSDVDIHDKRYLIEDAAFAVQEIERSGCKTFCLSLDQSADDYAGKIFRTGHYAVVDQPQKLTQSLTQLYLKLFRAYVH